MDHSSSPSTSGIVRDQRDIDVQVQELIDYLPYLGVSLVKAPVKTEKKLGFTLLIRRIKRRHYSHLIIRPGVLDPDLPPGVKYGRIVKKKLRYNPDRNKFEREALQARAHQIMRAIRITLNEKK